MAERYLIDTSGVIKYLNETFPPSGLSMLDEIVDNECVISFIVEIELQVWDPPNPEDQHVYKSFLSDSITIGVDSDIIREAIRVRKLYKLKLPDAIIAATALVNNMTLIADNDKDFTLIPELKYINPVRINKI
jgi:predicted nucleic acid-binding protein